MTTKGYTLDLALLPSRFGWLHQAYLLPSVGHMLSEARWPTQ